VLYLFIEVQDVCCRYLSAYEKNLCQPQHCCSGVHDHNSLAQKGPRRHWRGLETAEIRSVRSTRHEKRVRRTHLSVGGPEPRYMTFEAQNLLPITIRDYALLRLEHVAERQLVAHTSAC
jgi:hypothetical protein